MGQDLQRPGAHVADATGTARDPRQRAETLRRLRQSATRAMGLQCSRLRGPDFSGNSQKDSKIVLGFGEWFGNLEIGFRGIFWV